LSTEFTIKVTTTSEEVAAAQRIRRQVFVDEQGIPAQLDADGLDESAFHALCCYGDEVVATGRLVVLNSNGGVLARIAVLRDYRGRGIGRLIVAELEAVASRLGIQELTLHPHKHLERFYGNLGYKRVPGTSSVGKHELITMQKNIQPSHGRSVR